MTGAMIMASVVPVHGPKVTVGGIKVPYEVMHGKQPMSGHGKYSFY